MQRILAALDFSPVAERVLELAASLAASYGAQLTLVHVAAPDPEFVGYGIGPEGVREQRARELREEHRELQARSEALRGRGIEAKALLVAGPTVEQILEEARGLDADLIVIGSHGHGLVHRVLVGSTTEGVLRGAACPVLVVPSAEGDGD